MRVIRLALEQVPPNSWDSIVLESSVCPVHHLLVQKIVMGFSFPPEHSIKRDSWYVANISAIFRSNGKIHVPL